MRIAVLTFGLVFSAPAFADDPAIVVCEAAVKTGLKAPKSYERVSADISGTSVLLTFDAANEYNAPLRHNEECKFEINRHAYSLHYSSDVNIYHIIARIKELHKQYPQKIKEETGSVQREFNSLVREGEILAMKSILQEIAAIGTGLYPIEQGHTQLGR